MDEAFFLQSISLRSKSFVGKTLMLLILLLFPSLFVYSDSVGKALDSNIQYMEQLNNQANLNVNLLFSLLDRVNFIHYSDGELRRILLADASEKSSIERFEDDTYLRNALNHAFRNDSFVVRGRHCQPVWRRLLQRCGGYGGVWRVCRGHLGGHLLGRGPL